MSSPTADLHRPTGALLPRRLRKPLLAFFVLGTLVAVSARLCKVDLSEFFPGLLKGVEVLRFFFPPDWSSLQEMLAPALVTVLLAAVRRRWAWCCRSFLASPERGICRPRGCARRRAR